MAYTIETQPIFEFIKECQIEFGRTVAPRKEDMDFSKSLLCNTHSQIFIWNSAGQNIVTCGVQTAPEESKDMSYNSSSDIIPMHTKEHNSTGKWKGYQMLLCTNPPVYGVDHIQLNSTGQLMVISGHRGFSIMEMPRRWGKYSQYENGKEKISCKTTPFAERSFVNNIKLKVLHVDWHPGSPSASHLLVLTSDNCIRVYNVLEPDQAEAIFELGEIGSRAVLPASKQSFRVTLGETAVSFSVGRILTADKNVSMMFRNDHHTKYNLKAIDKDVWPVYILHGNGDVYLLYTAFNRNACCVGSRLVGPLTMHPTAEDNYGVDACSILCLPSVPPVLVVSTCAGHLYHCIVLNNMEDSQNASEDASEDRQEPSLYVYEGIELELSLTTLAVDSAELVQNDFSCPISVQQDPTVLNRYHCCHTAGVHIVEVTWLDNLQQLSDDASPNLLVEFYSQDRESVVEHVLCTKPLASSRLAPVMGLCVISEPLLCPRLYCLTSCMECITLRLKSSRCVTPHLLSSETTQPTTSPMRKLYKEPFDQHIRKILTRGTSNPLLRSDPSSELTNQECFQLLSRATQVFREEYINKQELARDEIQRRIRILCELKTQQLSDLAACQQDCDALKDNARNLAEKYEDASERQERLLIRLESLLRDIQVRVPILSDGEREMHCELQTMRNRVQIFTSAIKQVKIKREYQKRQIDSAGLTTSSQSPSLSKTQATQLKNVLKDESDQIQELMASLRKMDIELGP